MCECTETDFNKINTIKTMLQYTDSTHDQELFTYLKFAEQAILKRLYTLTEVPPDAVFPDKYASVQIMSVIVGIDSQGSENHKTHNENGVNITFKYTDMLDYIKNNVIPFAKVG